MQKALSAILLSLAWVASGAGLTSNVRAEELVVSTIGITGDTFQLATAWSNLLARQGGPLKITPVDGRGSGNTVRMVATKRADIGFLGSPHFRDATAKTGAFAKEPDNVVEIYKTMRALFSIPTGMGQYIARADSNIRSIADLKGKRVGIGAPGGSGGRVTTLLLKAHGIDSGDFHAQYLEHNASFDALGNGQIDASIAWGGIPEAGIFNLSRSQKLRFVSPAPDKFDAFRGLITYGDMYVFRKFNPEDIKAAYGDQIVADQPVYFWTFPMLVLVRSDMPDDTAYQLTKIVWDNLDAIKKDNNQLKLMSFDNALERLSAPLHPGAAKYFKEKGVQVPN
jgi:TRAP transporter TAXI family solute receptor